MVVSTYPPGVPTTPAPAEETTSTPIGLPTTVEEASTYPSAIPTTPAPAEESSTLSVGIPTSEPSGLTTVPVVSTAVSPTETSGITPAPSQITGGADRVSSGLLAAAAGAFVVFFM